VATGPFRASRDVTVPLPVRHVLGRHDDLPVDPAPRQGLVASVIGHGVVLIAMATPARSALGQRARAQQLAMKRL